MSRTQAPYTVLGNRERVIVLCFEISQEDKIENTFVTDLHRTAVEAVATVFKLSSGWQEGQPTEALSTVGRGLYLKGGQFAT